jgi:hypothetical protein
MEHDQHLAVLIDTVVPPQGRARPKDVGARLAIVVAALSLAGGCFDRAASAAPGGEDLVFVGKILSIAQGGASPLKRWVVTADVEKVVSGQFSGHRFEFAIHSPAMSGLEVGHAYTIRATWTGNGYEVDSTQWRRRSARARAPDPPPDAKHQPGRCDPLYDQLRREYETFLAERRQCRTKADCDLAMAACPLPIYSAVSAGAKQEVQDQAEHLVQRTAPEHCLCVADVGPPEVACRKGTCTEVKRRY